MIGLSINLWQTFQSNSVTAGAGVTSYAREYTADTGNEVIDLSEIGPTEDGAASYSLTAATGASLVGDVLTIDTATASAGQVNVDRVDDAGTRTLRLNLTLVTATIDVVSDAATVTYGEDTADDTSVVVPITGGTYNGQSVSFTPGDVKALGDGDGFPVIGTEIALTTDIDADDLLASDDVAELQRAALFLYNGAFAAPTITRHWRDLSGALGNSTTVYTADGLEDTVIFLREVAGSGVSNSPTIEVTDTSNWDVVAGAGEVVVNNSPTPPSAPTVASGDGQVVVN